MKIITSSVPLNTELAAGGRAGLTLTAQGWFWPAGIAGETGVEIGEIRVRGVTLIMRLTPENPRPVAGGPPLSLTISVAATGPLRIGSAEPALPFGSLAFRLFGPGGQAGAGTLSGGNEGDGASRLVEVVDGRAVIDYTPPALKAEDELVIALDNGENGPGMEIGRFPLNVEEA
jgi:hypothetical protein